MASGDEAANQFWKNAKKDAEQLYEKVKQYPLISLFFILAVVLIVVVPHWQVSGISNSTVQATQENQDRATLAQILGGVAIAIGLYYTWRRIGIAEEDLKATKEGQITERFTRAIEQLGAIDQLGNPALEIRLGGIYALKKIADKSEEYYWPIMEILTAYVRKNSPIENGNTKVEDSDGKQKISIDIQAILTVIGERKKSFETDEDNKLNLQRTYLRGYHLGPSHFEWTNFEGANLSEADLYGAHLEWANLEGTNLECANFQSAHLEWSNLEGANLRKAYLPLAYLEDAILEKANLEGANLSAANLKRAYLRDAHLEGANFIGAHLENAVLADANLIGAHLEKAILSDAHFEYANLKRTHIQLTHLERAHLEWSNLEGANLNDAHLEGAHLKGAEGLSLSQLSRVKTLYNVELDEELENELRAKGYSHLFDKPNDEP